MTLRVVQINCVIDELDRNPAELLHNWRTLPLVATATARAGAEVVVLQASRRAALHESNGVTYHFVPEPRLRAGSGSGLMPWRLSAALKRLHADVVHFHGLDFPAHLRAVCSGRAPVLVQDHASAPRTRARLCRRWGSAKVAAAAFSSAAQAEPFRQAELLPAGLPVFEVPESSTSFTPGDQVKARWETGIFGSPALLWVARLDANKDPLTLLRAVRLALPHVPEAHLWCVYTDAPLLPQVEAMLREDPPLAAHVHLLGTLPHEKVEAACRAADLFVLASRRENCSYALIEALACGLTPIVSDLPSFSSLTGNGAVGALAAPGNVSAFATAIVAEAAKPRNEGRAAALSHFDKHLSPSALGKRLVAIYETVAAGLGR